MNRIVLSSILFQLLLSAIIYCNWCDAADIDRNLNRRLRTEIARIRAMKNTDRKPVAYDELLHARQRILARYEHRPEVRRFIHERFFWDVARYRRREIGVEGLSAIISDFLAVSDDLDREGKLRQQFAALEMLGEVDREQYQQKYAGLLAQAAPMKDTLAPAVMKCRYGYCNRLWSWREDSAAIKALEAFSKDYSDDAAADRYVFSLVYRMLREYSRHPDTPPEKLMQSLQPFLPRFQSAMSPREKERALSALCRAELAAGDYREALVLAMELKKEFPKNASHCLLAARILCAQGKSVEAVAAVHETILTDPLSTSAFQAQALLVEIALQKKDYPKALGHARLLFDVAMTEKELAAAVQRIAKVMTLRDGHMVRANVFILFQKGEADPAGPKAEIVKRYVDPAFRKNLVAAAAECGNAISGNEYRRRCRYLLFAGRPEQALCAAFAAYRYLETSTRNIESTMWLIAAAMRARAGQALAARTFLTFQEYGPAGPDRRLKTGDDCRFVFPESSAMPAKAGADAADSISVTARVEESEAQLLDALSGDPGSRKVFGLLVDYGSLLSAAGRSSEALAVARAAYAWAYDNRLLDSAVAAVASALRGLDHNLVRANAFLEFQRYGPAGRDGVVGTEDDLADPLHGVKTPLPKTLLAAVGKLAAQKSGSGRHRQAGYLYLISGQPDDALRAFRLAREKMGFSAGEIRRHTADVLAAFKALAGHTFTGKSYLAYQQYGPNGKDGRSGTEDDLKDPMAGFIK